MAMLRRGEAAGQVKQGRGSSGGRRVLEPRPAPITSPEPQHPRGSEGGQAPVSLCLLGRGEMGACVPCAACLHPCLPPWPPLPFHPAHLRLHLLPGGQEGWRRGFTVESLMAPRDTWPFHLAPHLAPHLVPHLASHLAPGPLVNGTTSHLLVNVALPSKFNYDTLYCS
ncbi:hypothetical protein Pcinc_039180 [Petrolisthes cinctipes]|uniref:Uncharacterized protein n=1 Tax=Petrolisthes cinctipes TaxID=88211 RepID=A0AAE1BPD7_PETCI|nr:hypothetical protein Pcinc_039180 [Petrolisthes cinctipes]